MTTTTTHDLGDNGPRLPEGAAVLDARRNLADAMHAMHADQRIIINLELAETLSQAWDAYDNAIRAELYARVLQLEIVATPAAEVVAADEGASIAQDWNLVLLWDRIEAMKAALAELGGTPGLQTSGVEGTPSQQNPIGTASESLSPEKAPKTAIGEVTR